MVTRVALSDRRGHAQRNVAQAPFYLISTLFDKYIWEYTSRDGATRRRATAAGLAIMRLVPGLNPFADARRSASDPTVPRTPRHAHA